MGELLGAGVTLGCLPDGGPVLGLRSMLDFSSSAPSCVMLPLV